ncbi:hypothetical protein CEY11_13835 [Candidimonas nitroreducens]|uniref:HTH gntR-type domain-containing protein n=1 Tax=Candidimonas nitroreducens TaxID=683354 RepID=A0A225MEK1_9BURK|nr:hypothetical protein CEY11_13835 [Candidimonas nitroreducens]
MLAETGVGASPLSSIGQQYNHQSNGSQPAVRMSAAGDSSGGASRNCLRSARHPAGSNALNNSHKSFTLCRHHKLCEFELQTVCQTNMRILPTTENTPLKAPKSVVRVVAPLRQQVYGILHEAIAQGHFKPGQRLVERELCETLQISRPLLREVLRNLEAEGLIRPVEPRGLEVARITIEDAHNIYEIRLALEGTAVAGFVRSASDAQRQALHVAFANFEEACKTEDSKLVHTSKNRFYEAILAGCNNPLLSDFLTSLHSRIQLLRGASLSEPNRLPNTLKELRAIHDAICANDEALAKRACNIHIRNAARVTKEALERQQQVVEEIES